jgi:hypothetical protein
MKNRIESSKQKVVSRKNFSKIGCFIVCAVFLFSVTIKPTHAQIPFGGNILWIQECTCSGGLLMYIFDLKTKLPTPIVYQFGISRLNQNFNIFTLGVETLGSYTLGGVCLMVSLDCAGIPVTGTVTPRPFPGIGTSLVPGL